MTVNSDSLLAEEERLAEEVYDRLVRPVLRPEDDGTSPLLLRRTTSRSTPTTLRRPSGCWPEGRERGSG